MIIDTLENLHKYVALNPLFTKVIDYINSTDITVHGAGKELIDGERVFANFCVAKGKTKEEAKLETHNKMVDIQIPFNCAETMGYTPRKDLPEMDYNEGNDVTFYEGLAQQYVTVEPGMFAIFFPQDGHAPCVSESDEIRKVIFKIESN